MFALQFFLAQKSKHYSLMQEKCLLAEIGLGFIISSKVYNLTYGN